MTDDDHIQSILRGLGPMRQMTPEECAAYDARQKALDERAAREMLANLADHEQRFVDTLPKAMQSMTLFTYFPDPKPQKAAKEGVTDWLTNSDAGLFLHGPVGVGKTHLAIGAARLLAKRGKRAAFYTTAGLFERIKRAFDGKAERFDPARVAKYHDLIVLDDLGVGERMTDWQRDTLHGFIDALYLQGVTLIATSNLTYAELGATEVLGERATSRLIAMTMPVAVGGSDYRVKQHKEARS